MNTLIMLVAIMVITWFSLQFFTKSETVLGVAMMGITLLVIAWALQAIVEDVGDAVDGFKKRRSVKSGRQGRQ